MRLPWTLLVLTIVGCGAVEEGTPETAEDDATTAVKVVAIGDIACQPGIAPTAKRCQHAATSDLVPAAAKKILLLGDNQYSRGELTSYQGSFDQTWGRHMSRLVPVLGNHEYQTKAATGYFTYFGEKAGDPAKGYYSTNVGSWHVLAINTNDNCRRIPCDEGSEQLAWVREDLEKNKAKKCTVALFHHPRWSSGEHGDNPNIDPLWRALAAGGVDLVLAGHDHDYERFAPRNADGARDDEGGMRSFVVGTGGIGFRGFGDALSEHSEVRQNDTFGILQLSLSATGYAWEFLPIAGSTFEDKGKGRCH
jgi:acid phosphatase type 7